MRDSDGTMPRIDTTVRRSAPTVEPDPWRDATLGTVSFRDYVEQYWLPSKHIEPTTKAAYVSKQGRRSSPATQESLEPRQTLLFI